MTVLLRRQQIRSETSFDQFMSALDLDLDQFLEKNKELLFLFGVRNEADKEVTVVTIPATAIRAHFDLFASAHVVLVPLDFFFVLNNLFGLQSHVDVAKMVKRGEALAVGFGYVNLLLLQQELEVLG